MTTLNILVINEWLQAMQKLVVKKSSVARCRDGHDTDTKYRYCRYLQVRGKYWYCHQVSLVFDTEPVLFMVSVYAWKPVKNVKKKAKKKLKMRIFFWKHVW